MTQNINLLPASPTLSDLLTQYGKQLKTELNCHHVGTIETFNSVTQTAQATINYTKTFNQLNGTGTPTIITQNYPIVVGCPVVCLGGGTGALTFPISPGDECLILFNDRDMSNWYGGSSSSAPATGRLHSFSDAIIIVGIRSLAHSLIDYDTSAVSLQNGLNSVKISPTTVVATVGTGNTITLESTKAVVALSTGVTLELDATGKLKITNLTGGVSV